MAAGSGSLGRLLGLGFLFGAKDEGAVRTTEAIQEGFEGIEQAVQRVGAGTQSLTRFGNAIAAINVMAINRTNDALGSLADRAGLLTGGDTSLEAFGAQAGLAFRQATAGLGEYTDTVRQYRGQITGAAFTLGVDVGELTRGVAAIARTGHSLEDFGLTVRDIAGLSQAGILDTNALTSALTGLAEGYGLGAEGARRLIDDMTAIGTQVGSGADAVRQLPAAIEAADAAISALPPGVESSVDDMIRSLTLLAAGTQKTLGGTFEDAFAGATATLGVLSEARQDLSRNFTGLSSEFPEMATGMANAFGSIDDAMNLMMADPARFVQQMQGVYASMEDGALKSRFTQQILSRFPESMRFMIMAGEEGATNLRDLADAAGDSEGALSRMARSSSGSARTFGESLELVEEVFKSRLNRMARRHYPNFERQVINRQRAGFNRLSETIGGLAAQRGPLNTVGGAMGALTRTMVALRRGGVTGLSIALQSELGEAFPNVTEKIAMFLPMIGEMGEGLFEAATQAGPLLLAMTQMQGRIPGLGMAMRLLFNPITLIGGGLFLMVRHWELVGPILQRVSGEFRDFTRTILKKVIDIDWVQLGSDLVDGVLSIFGFVGDTVQSQEMSDTAAAFAEGFRNLFDATWIIVRGLVTGMWDRIVAFVFEPENFTQRLERGAGVAGVAFGAAMFTPLRGPIIRAAMGLFSHLGGFLQSGAGALLRGGVRGVLTKIPLIGAVIGVLFDLPDIIDSFQTGGITEGLNRLFRSVINGLLLGIPDMLEEFLGFDFISDMFDFLFEATNLGNISRAIEDGDIGKAIFEGLFATIGFIPNLLRAALTEVLGFDVLSEFWDSVLGPTLDELVDFWTDEINPIIGEAGTLFIELGDIATEFWEDTLKPIFSDIKESFIEVFVKTIMPWAKKTWKFVSVGAKQMWMNHIKPMLVKFARKWTETFTGNLRMAIEVFRAVTNAGIRTFHSISGAIERLAIRWVGWRRTLQEGWAAIGIHIRSTIGEAVEFVSFHFSNMINGLESALLRIERGFRALPLAIMRFFRDTMMGDSPMARGIRTVLQGLGINIGTVDQQMRDAMSGLEENVRSVDRELDQLAQARTNREREHTAAVIGFETQRRIARARTAAALDLTNERLAQSDREQAETIATQIGAVNEFANAAARGVERVRLRTQRFISDAASGALAARAEERRAERTAEARAETMAAGGELGIRIETAVSTGQIDVSTASAALEALEVAVQTGDVSRVEELGAEVMTAIEEQRPAPARERRRRRGAPVTPQETEGRTESRVEAQQEEREAAAQLQAVRIQEISAEAARALARAMGGSSHAGRPRDAAGRPRRPRGGGGPTTGIPDPGF